MHLAAPASPPPEGCSLHLPACADTKIALTQPQDLALALEPAEIHMCSFLRLAQVPLGDSLSLGMSVHQQIVSSDITNGSVIFILLSGDQEQAGFSSAFIFVEKCDTKSLVEDPLDFQM